MTLGNYTPFKAKHVTAFKFGATAFPESAMTSTTTSILSSFTEVCGTHLLDLVGDPDTANPTISYAFAKDFSTSGNELAITEEALLGADTTGTQNMEITSSSNSKIEVECTVVYRNNIPTSIFSSSTKVAMITMDNDESSTTGVLNIVFNNITVTQVGSLTRNSDGFLEQKLKFTCRGGTSGTLITVTSAGTWSKYRLGLDYAEELQTA